MRGKHKEPVLLLVLLLLLLLLLLPPLLSFFCCCRSRLALPRRVSSCDPPAPDNPPDPARPERPPYLPLHPAKWRRVTSLVHYHSEKFS